MNLVRLQTCATNQTSNALLSQATPINNLIFLTNHRDWFFEILQMQTAFHLVTKRTPKDTVDIAEYHNEFWKATGLMYTYLPEQGSMGLEDRNMAGVGCSRWNFTSPPFLKFLALNMLNYTFIKFLILNMLIYAIYILAQVIGSLFACFLAPWTPTPYQKCIVFRAVGSVR